MSGFTLTALRWWHIEDLLPIEAELFGEEAWTAAMFWSELANGTWYRVAVEDGTVLGYGGVAINGEEAWINNIAVRASQQRRGIGAALLTALVAHAVQNRTQTLALEVAVDNGPAQRMYERFGFDGVAVRKGYYQPSNTDALVMIKDMSSESEA